METIAKFLEENSMANPLTSEPPSHLVLKDLLRQADELMAKSPESSRRPDEVMQSITESKKIVDSYAPVRQLEEQFYTGDNFQRILYIDSYRRGHGLDPLFNMANPFPSEDKLIGAISHGFEMTRLAFARKKFAREKEASKIHDEFVKAQTYAYRMIEVMESTYMS
jgi:hypothetical protein